MVYNTAGTYNVTLIAINENGSDTLVKTNYIKVGIPIANFTANNTNTFAKNQVIFKNTSLRATSYVWSFPGGTPATSTDVNPIVAYRTAGTYSVTLKASNTNGDSTITQINYITVNPLPTRYYMKNRLYPQYYLYDGGNGRVLYGTRPDTSALYQWVQEAGSGYIRLRNFSSSNYMHVEHQTGYVENGSIDPNWWSARWVLQTLDSSWINVTNFWQSSERLTIVDLLGYLQYTTTDEQSTSVALAGGGPPFVAMDEMPSSLDSTTVAQTAMWQFINVDSFSTELPVAGMNLQAKAYSKQQVQLAWSTFTEANNKGFEIQRGGDGTTFAPLSFINTKALNGNSSAPLQYSFTDNAPLSGINYYRLKQTDIGAQFNYSNTVSVFVPGKKSSVNVYPNPVDDNLHTTGAAASANFRIVNMSGQTVKTANSTTINVKDLAPGIYFLQTIENGTLTTINKFIKK